MSRLDNVKRLIKEDFEPKHHALIGKIGFVINTFMEQTTNIINGNIDFTNLTHASVTFKIEVDACGTPLGDATIRTGALNPFGLQVVRAINVDNPSGTFVDEAPFISFTAGVGSENIKITNIRGLPANSAFSLTVIAIN